MTKYLIVAIPSKGQPKVKAITNKMNEAKEEVRLRTKTENTEYVLAKILRRFTPDVLVKEVEEN
jgi:hypothetical protein